MSQLAERVLREALQLPDREREFVAAKLFDSLNFELVEYDDQAWEEELRRRMEESDKGDLKSIPLEKAKKMIFEDMDDDEAA